MAKRTAPKKERRADKIGIKHPCTYCWHEIPDWRSNKKFCDEGCKSDHYNEQQTADNAEMGRVNRILKNNFKILKQVIGDERHTKIDKAKLEKKGFKFEFMTHQLGDYRNCYLLSWRPIEKDQVIINRTPTYTIERER